MDKVEREKEKTKGFVKRLIEIRVVAPPMCCGPS